MALGKNNNDKNQAADAGEPDEDNDELSGAFDAEQDTPEPVDPLAGSPAEASGDAPEGDAAPGGDLLNMFQSTSIEETDRSVLLELAGEVDLGDLLEELQTISAAIAVTRSGGGGSMLQDGFDERPERQFAREARVRRISA